MSPRAQNILVIKTDGLAAFVAAEPLYEAIRAAHPGARISLLTQTHLQRVAKASPYFDQVARSRVRRLSMQQKWRRRKSNGFTRNRSLAAPAAKKTDENDENAKTKGLNGRVA